MTESERIGDGDGTGRGYFIQSGGTHTVTTDLVVGAGGYYGSSGRYTLDAGSLSADSVIIGSSWSGDGSFSQSGGSNSVSGILAIATSTPLGRGRYDLSGGSLSSGSEEIGFDGTFNQTGGTHTVSNSIINSGTYNTSGGIHGSG